MERYPPKLLEQLVEECLSAVGAKLHIASATAESIVDADARGKHEQGMMRLPWIINKIRNGEIDPTAVPEKISDDDSPMVHLDAKSAVGQWVGHIAIEEVTEVAKKFGVCFLAIRHANDLGRIGEWTERAADESLGMISHVNARGHPSVAPNGCSDRILSTNPISIGLPTFRALPHPLILDMATSQVAHGTIEEFAQEGREIPTEWTTTATGHPVSSPSDFLSGNGALLPLGGRVTGYKGFGLGIMNELIAGTVSGGFVVGEDDRPPSGNDAVFIVFDPLSFTSQERFEEQIRTFQDFLKAISCSQDVSKGEPATNDGELNLPGERTYRRFARSEQEGVPISSETLDELENLTIELGCEGEFTRIFD